MSMAGASMPGEPIESGFKFRGESAALSPERAERVRWTIEDSERKRKAAECASLMAWVGCTR